MINKQRDDIQTQYSILRNQVEWLGDKNLTDKSGVEIAIFEIQNTLDQFKELILNQ